MITDPGGTVCARWRQLVSPEVYVIDAAGILRFHGIRGEYGEDFAPLVEALLKEAEALTRQKRQMVDAGVISDA